MWYLPTADFQGRVLGSFPTQADEQVVPRGWLERLPALAKETQVPEIGCDPARFGKDRTAIATRQGPALLRIRVLRQMDNLQVTAALKEEAAWAAAQAGLPPEAAKRIPIRIDVTGGLGTGPYDILRSEEYLAIPVIAGSAPIDKEQFVNKRSELWFQTRYRVQEKRMDLSRLPQVDRETVVRELAAPKYKVDGRGRKVVEEKQKTKDTLGYSPDVADGVNLAYGHVGRWWEDADLKAYLVARGSAPASEAAASRLPAWVT